MEAREVPHRGTVLTLAPPNKPLLTDGPGSLAPLGIPGRGTAYPSG